ncbi:MAG: DUF814 domain-containing protein [Calditrichaceae bacterium]|nr:DUF814 domain-containing protein [Calditrichaceae bacterium]MBN2707938.1 DUF814 domain-containing protein [Calditrichaceae bacterium]RQV95375.1 MAG: DUF814 domain-containing protein [Calditrichota bacterium]
MKTKLFRTLDNFEIVVGMDDVSNDILSLQTAHPRDLWFHVNAVPGSHVILKCGESGLLPGKENILLAASAAAWFSKMRNAGKVPVHYCYAENVSKPKGAKAGTVNIKKSSKIIVWPDITKLRETENKE